MTKQDVAIKLTTHLASCGMLMPEDWLAKNGPDSELQQAFQMAIDALTDNSGWISVKEMLPEDDERNKFHTDGILSMTTVLVYDKFRYVHIANRLKIDPCGNEYLDEHSTVGWAWSNNCKDVTHWMPLPEPPKED